MAAFDMSCPFHKPQTLDWKDTLVQLQAQRIPLKSGLDHLSLKVTLEGTVPLRFEFDGHTLMLGFTASGWGKLHLSGDNVEKLESGQWFQISSEGLTIDRTSSKGLQLEIFLCSQEFADTLSSLEPEHGLSALNDFRNKNGGDNLRSGTMNSDALATAQAIARSSSGSIKHRLQLEANALGWLAETLGQSATANKATAASLNANDREAIDLISSAMKEDPSCEFSMEELCEIGGINEHKLKSAFKHIHGKTAFTYLREVRMDYAAGLLREDRLSVIQVANEVGYSNASHFARAFKDRHSLLPKAYQCLHRF